MNEETENILVSKGISPTAMRTLVLDYLLKQKNAISLTDLEKEFERSDRVTLYRTLKTFEENGMVHEIKDGNEPAKFALCQNECEAGVHNDFHLHFYCTACKKLFCLPKTRVPKVNLPSKFRLQELNLVARGLCSHCS